MFRFYFYFFEFSSF
ncbi:hypothetical protein DERP_007128 [Dermatophagoides pteronyssinus]|uniref:Uncharacterized protein n=1 Tax=Dermatophagoides pteronyssinus TaxID=6956 RepID=A0ABQ8JU80_DERPT|nr:hypothetical protein DERP_007128 [Dermatophagoides pteronyssinus]